MILAHSVQAGIPVNPQTQYLAWAQGRPIACLAWSSAPRHLGSRDRFIGWSGEARRRNIRFLAYNTRFLILPWIRVPHLASHILGRVAAALPEDATPSTRSRGRSGSAPSTGSSRPPASGPT